MTRFDLEAIKTRCEAARHEVDRLCQGKVTWTMSIPVREDDTDVVFTNSFRDIPVLLAEIGRLRAVVVKAIKQRQIEVAEMYGDCPNEVERLQAELKSADEALDKSCGAPW